MTVPITHGCAALTEKEKQTLRLIVRGHDAKSIARSLDLSVHTINERLRDARRKLAVSSSREAARLLRETEGEEDNFVGDVKIGDVLTASRADRDAAPIPGARRGLRFAWIATGVALMTIALAFLAFAASPYLSSAPAQDTPAAEAIDPHVVDAARQFLLLGDQGRWDDGYRLTGKAFQQLNTRETWAAVSEKVRVPLGAVISRVLIGQENLPAPPDGYEVVKFRTSFANKANTVETVTLDREEGGWRVVGITVG